MEPEKKPAREKPGIKGILVRLAVVLAVLLLLGIYGADAYDRMMDFFKTPGYLIGGIAILALAVVGVVLLVRRRKGKKE